MKSGSVIVDMAASALGGNCELSQAGETIVTDNGVTIIAPDNLPATMPAGASAFYARNISALLLGMVKDGDLNLDFEDEVTKATVITHGGAVVVRARQEAARAGPGGRSRRSRVSPELLSALTVFVLAILVGFAVISKVPATLHTPLMSGANSIHGIVLVGSMFIAVEATDLGQPGPVAGRRGVRHDERGRRLRGHRPDAPDVPQEARRAQAGRSVGRRRRRADRWTSRPSRSSSASPGWRARPASCSA